MTIDIDVLAARANAAQSKVANCENAVAEARDAVTEAQAVLTATQQTLDRKRVALNAAQDAAAVADLEHGNAVNAAARAAAIAAENNPTDA